MGSFHMFWKMWMGCSKCSLPCAKIPLPYFPSSRWSLSLCSLKVFTTSDQKYIDHAFYLISGLLWLAMLCSLPTFLHHMEVSTVRICNFLIFFLFHCALWVYSFDASFFLAVWHVLHSKGGRGQNTPFTNTNHVPSVPPSCYVLISVLLWPLCWWNCTSVSLHQHLIHRDMASLKNRMLLLV